MLRIINMHSGILASVHFDPNESFVDGQIAEFDSINNRYQVANGTGTNFSLIVDSKNGLNQSCSGNFVQVYQGNCEVETDQIDKTRAYLSGEHLYITQDGRLTNVPNALAVGRVLRISANMQMQVDWFGLLPIQQNLKPTNFLGFTFPLFSSKQNARPSLSISDPVVERHNGMNCNNCKEFNEYIDSPNCGEKYICYYCRKHVLFI